MSSDKTQQAGNFIMQRIGELQRLSFSDADAADAYAALNETAHNEADAQTALYRIVPKLHSVMATSKVDIPLNGTIQALTMCKCYSGVMEEWNNAGQLRKKVLDILTNNQLDPVPLPEIEQAETDFLKSSSKSSAEDSAKTAIHSALSTEKTFKAIAPWMQCDLFYDGINLSEDAIEAIAKHIIDQNTLYSGKDGKPTDFSGKVYTNEIILQKARRISESIIDRMGKAGVSNDELAHYERVLTKDLFKKKYTSTLFTSLKAQTPARRFDPTAHEVDFSVPLSGKDKPEYLLFPWFPLREVVVMDSPGQIGKSSLIAVLVAQLLKGGTVWGVPNIPPKNILYFTEDEEIKIKSVVISSGAHGIPQGHLHVIDHLAFNGDMEKGELPKPRLGTPEFEQLLQQEHKPDLVIIDTVECFIDETIDTNSTSIMTDFMSKVKRLAAKYDCCMLLIGHPSKGAAVNKTISVYDIAGSSAYSNAARAMFSVVYDVENHDNRIMICKKSTNGLSASRVPSIFFHTTAQDGGFPFAIIDEIKEYSMEQYNADVTSSRMVKEIRERIFCFDDDLLILKRLLFEIDRDNPGEKICLNPIQINALIKSAYGDSLVNFDDDKMYKTFNRIMQEAASQQNKVGMKIEHLPYADTLSKAVIIDGTIHPVNFIKARDRCWVIYCRPAKQNS